MSKDRTLTVVVGKRVVKIRGSPRQLKEDIEKYSYYDFERSRNK